MSEKLSPEKCQGLILEHISQWEEETAHTIHPQYRQAINNLVTPENYTPGLVNFLLYTVSTKYIIREEGQDFVEKVQRAYEYTSGPSIDNLMLGLAYFKDETEEELNYIEASNYWYKAINLGLRLQIIHQTEDQTFTLDPQVEQLFFPKTIS